MTPILQVNNVGKNYGGVHALCGVDLEVKKGETIAVIGPSGCGKTTLLRCLGLFDKINTGEIFFDGKPIITAESGQEPRIHGDVNQYHCRAGMVFQHLNIWPHLNVLENVILAPMQVLHLNRHEVVDKAMGLLGKMGVGGKAGDYPQTLSGGQLQRVALARALIMDPQLLLLDEITSALDPELVGEVLDIIADLASNGMTMVIVTHEMQFAADVAHRCIFMDRGKIAEQGLARDMFQAPKTEKLRSFLGRLLHRRIKEEFVT